MNQALQERGTWRHMKDSTAADWGVIAKDAEVFWAKLYERVIDHLKLLDGDFGGFPVDRLTHCLQTATLAHKDGKDEEYVVCALLHDIGDTLCPSNHAELAATILEPYVSPENHWMIKHHATFQGYYFFEYLGLDKNARDQYRDHPCFERTLEFIEKYDAPAFDTDAETYPMEFFEPMLKNVLARPVKSPYMEEGSTLYAE